MHVGGAGGPHRRRRPLARRLQPRRARRSSRSSPQPDIHSAEHAKRFLQLLRQTDRRARDLGRGDGEGLAARSTSTSPCGPRAPTSCAHARELKNMNSFNFAGEGIEREIQRQIQIYESGGEVEQETMHFDPANELSAAAALEGRGAGLSLPAGAGPRLRSELPRGARRGAARAAPGATGRADRPDRRGGRVRRLAEGLVVSERDRPLRAGRRLTGRRSRTSS